ncbi:dipeptidase 1-like [Neocloeon triangulifer]|uniref:dipeptidase 1-like n=1 Tax=Neocloeon triangulifer TaxID=2078957 RepID=UPI00286F0481|nr:dipeptidase 1-like [Neocloeon triangulifer]
MSLLPRIIQLLVLVALSSATRRSPEEARLIAERVLESVPLVDGHNDLAMNIRNKAAGQLANVDLSQNLTNHPLWVGCGNCHTDIPRLRAGMVGAQFWSAFTGCTTQYRDAAQKTLDAIDIIKRFSQKHNNDFKFVTTAQGIWDAFNEGKIASLIGVEGGHSMDNRLAILRQFYDVGARYMTLNHVCNTPWCDTSNVDDPASGVLPNNNGLSDFGRIVLQEMNRLGMLIDLAHVSKAAQIQTFQVSRAPVIYSHSSAYALCDHHRNVHDDVLQLVKSSNSIVMVNFYTWYVTCSSTATIQDVADHVNHIANVAGFDHVGIGSDFDGIERVPEGLNDVSFYPDLFTLLALDPAWTEANLRKLAGENLIRVFTDVERVRDEMAAEGITPFEENIPVGDLGNNTACYGGY